MLHRTRIGLLVLVLAAVVHAPVGAQGVPRARQLYERAGELEKRGNAAAALSLLWEAAGLAPQDGEIHDALGSALERIGALDAAVEAYRAAADARRAPPGAANHLVLALVKAGRSEEAIARARARATESPGDPERWFTLGLAQSDVDVVEAVESFRRVLAIDARHGLARYNLALVYLHTDRLDAAVEELQKANAIQARPEIHYTLGTVYQRQGDLDRAVAALGDAVSAKPDYADAHLALGTVLKTRGDLKRAAASLQRAARLRPDLAAPQIVLAQTLAVSGDDKGARQASAEAERLTMQSQRSQQAATLTAAGTQKLDAGDAAGAAETFRRATQAFDAFAPAHYQLGRALERLGDHEAAKAAFARAQQLNSALVPPR